MRGIILVMALLCVGCHRQLLTCRTEFLYPDYLASEQINTPDPLRKGFCGQQIVIRWSLPKSVDLKRNTSIRLQIRFGDRSEQTLDIPISCQKGWWTYSLINEAYWEKEGILAFKADLQQEGQTLANWSHFLWAERIEIFKPCP